jgi:hypothetical protein
MFPVYDGKCLTRKAVRKFIEKFSQGLSKVADDVQPGAEMAEATIKRLLCCGFRRTGKAMGQVYQCCWGIYRERRIFFQVRMSHALRFISIY